MGLLNCSVCVSPAIVTDKSLSGGVAVTFVLEVTAMQTEKLSLVTASSAFGNIGNFLNGSLTSFSGLAYRPSELMYQQACGKKIAKVVLRAISGLYARIRCIFFKV